MSKTTEQENKLFYALKNRNINCKSLVKDGIKTIDISIPEARLDIEVNGPYHYTSATQIKSDLDRCYWSQYRDHYDTLFIPNEAIDNNLDKVANAIATEVNRRIEEINKRENIFYIGKLLFYIIKREIKYKKNRKKR